VGKIILDYVHFMAYPYKLLKIDPVFCKIDVVLKASRAILMRRFSLTEAPLGLFKFISDYLPYFENKIIFFNIIAKHLN
jgi:hypothetical protein